MLKCHMVSSQSFVQLIGWKQLSWQSTQLLCIIEVCTTHKRCSSLLVRYIGCLRFLVEKYAADLKYCSLNCYRSTLFPALLPVDGFQVGQHPLLARLLKGVFIVDHRNQDMQRLGMCHKFYTTLGLLAQMRTYPWNCTSEVGSPPSIGVGALLFRFESPHTTGKKVFSWRGSTKKPYEKATGAFRRKDKLPIFLAINSPHSPFTTSTFARWLKAYLVATNTCSKIMLAEGVCL